MNSKDPHRFDPSARRGEPNEVDRLIEQAEERGARALLEWAKSKIYLDGQCESVEFSDLEAYFSEAKK